MPGATAEIAGVPNITPGSVGSSARETGIDTAVGSPRITSHLAGAVRARGRRCCRCRADRRTVGRGCDRAACRRRRSRTGIAVGVPAVPSAVPPRLRVSEVVPAHGSSPRWSRPDRVGRRHRRRRRTGHRGAPWRWCADAGQDGHAGDRRASDRRDRADPGRTQPLPADRVVDDRGRHHGPGHRRPSFQASPRGWSRSVMSRSRAARRRGQPRAGCAQTGRALARVGADADRAATEHVGDDRVLYPA